MRRLLKDILRDVAAELNRAKVVNQPLLDELADYQSNTPLYRVDYALPVFRRDGTVARTSRPLFAFSGVTNRWHHGWFSLDVETKAITFHDSGLHYRGTIFSDFLLWMEDIPFPNRYLKPIQHDDETKDIYLKKAEAAQVARKPRSKKGVAAGDAVAAEG